MIQRPIPNGFTISFADNGIEDLRLGDYFKETPLGQGKVDFDRYLDALRQIGYHGFLTIEREIRPIRARISSSRWTS